MVSVVDQNVISAHDYTLKILTMKLLGMGVHTYNLSYLGGRDQEDPVFRLVQARNH
jgi:hypothetical protein